MNKIETIILNEYLKPAEKKNYKKIGVEIEHPIVCFDSTKSLKEIGHAFFTYMTEQEEYTVTDVSIDGYIHRIERDGNSYSFDTFYGILEFSIKPLENLEAIENIRREMLAKAISFYSTYDCYIIGSGNNPFNKAKNERILSRFSKMTQKDAKGNIDEETGTDEFYNMCSTQTHLDIPFEKIVETYNFFNESSFVRAILLSNSPDYYSNQVLYCTRDDIWENSKSPNTGLINTHFNGIDELLRYISEEKLFYIESDEGYITTDISLGEYLSNNNKNYNFNTYRSYENVVINRFGCLEIRDDCTQPLNEALAATAFALGLALNVEKATDILSQFKAENGIDCLNSELRQMAKRGEQIAADDAIRKLLYELYSCAEDALLARNSGDEKFLEPLRGRIERLECPAKDYLNKYKSSCEEQELIKMMAEVSPEE